MHRVGLRALQRHSQQGARAGDPLPRKVPHHPRGVRHCSRHGHHKLSPAVHERAVQRHHPCALPRLHRQDRRPSLVHARPLHRRPHAKNDQRRLPVAPAGRVTAFCADDLHLRHRSARGPLHPLALHGRCDRARYGPPPPPCKPVLPLCGAGVARRHLCDDRRSLRPRWRVPRHHFPGRHHVRADQRPSVDRAIHARMPDRQVGRRLLHAGHLRLLHYHPEVPVPPRAG
mmetsp:Transcript_78461/g.177201  ORF Transcript_78461/g.177201 Transcript_78461/m.177201 type:complete len:229 (+) Transcript_78461:168-854(+)